MLKKIITLSLLLTLNYIHIYPQGNYQIYLDNAYSALKEGRTDDAQKAYNVYKRMSQVTDSEFEAQIEEMLFYGVENGYKWVNLGLSVKWATCNIGSTKPEEYGDYFAWGETSTKSDYSWTTYKYCNGNSLKLTKYCNNNKYGNKRFTDGRVTLETSDDVARVKWGGSWRMPTKDEFNELLNNCTWTWTTQNGVNGYRVISKKSGYTDRSIFLPVAGFRGGTTSLDYVGFSGCYWSSSLYTGRPDLVWTLNFYSGDHYTDSHDRSCGFTVRPVCP